MNRLTEPWERVVLEARKILEDSSVTLPSAIRRCPPAGCGMAGLCRGLQGGPPYSAGTSPAPPPAPLPPPRICAARSLLPSIKFYNICRRAQWPGRSAFDSHQPGGTGVPDRRLRLA